VIIAEIHEMISPKEERYMAVIGSHSTSDLNALLKTSVTMPVEKPSSRLDIFTSTCVMPPCFESKPVIP
jgi:hypothetical protein